MQQYHILEREEKNKLKIVYRRFSAGYVGLLTLWWQKNLCEWEILIKVCDVVIVSPCACWWCIRLRLNKYTWYVFWAAEVPKVLLKPFVGSYWVLVICKRNPNIVWDWGSTITHKVCSHMSISHDYSWPVSTWSHVWTQLSWNQPKLIQSLTFECVVHDPLVINIQMFVCEHGL